MENKTRKLNGIEKICLIGIISGTSLLCSGVGLDVYNSMVNQNRKNNLKQYGALLLISSGLGYTRYLALSEEDKKLSSKRKFY